MTRVAALDIGTNSLLLLVAEERGGVLEPLAERCRIERLGQGVDRTGALDDAAIARALDALTEYAGIVRAHGVDRVAAIGTQALREARNGERFLTPARELLGVPVEVIGGEREAELAFAAVRRAFPELVGAGELVVCDVGGGSTEYIVGDARGVRSLLSVPIGGVRLTERHLANDPPSPDEARALVAAIDEALAAVALPRRVPLVGIAGTVTTLAAVAVALAPYDPGRVQGMRLPRGEVERQLARYLELPTRERARIAGLEPKRADVIPAGAAIVARTMHRMDADTLVVSDRGIRWGLAYELLERGGG